MLGDTGYPDGWAIKNNINPLDPDIAMQDLSGDGLTTLEAYHFGKDPWDSTPIPPITLAGGTKGVTFTLSQPIPNGALVVFELENQRYPLTHTNAAITVFLPASGVTHGSFTPPDGMDGVGLALSGETQGLYVYDPDGVFGTPTPAYPSGGMGVMSSDGNGKGIALEYSGFAIDPPSVTYHNETAIHFTATNIPETVANTVTWTSDFGALGHTVGRTNVLNPEGHGAVKVIATLSSGAGSLSATATVTRCVQKVYHAPIVSFAGTDDNVSPHLGLDTLAAAAQFTCGYWRWTCGHPNTPDEPEYGSVADLRICHNIIATDPWKQLHVLRNNIYIDTTPSVIANWDCKRDDWY